LVIYLYAAEDGLEKSVSIIMLFVSLLGEFAVAGFDMYMNISENVSTMNWTPTDLRNMSYIIAGLALLNGLAMVVGIAGQQIMDDLSSVRKPKKPVQTTTNNVPVRHTEPMNMNALDIDALTNEIYARIKANGNGAADPTNQPRR
jgi:hypothetical protein